MIKNLEAPAGGILHRAPLVLTIFLTGMYFAVLQFAYYFMLEAYLTSRAVSFFIALFFWLIGFLLGLQAGKRVNYPLTIISGTVAYYLFLLVNRLFPFEYATLPVLAVCIIMSGFGPGNFFIQYSGAMGRIKNLFFLENNGFILGLILALIGSETAGEFFVDYGPLLSGIPVIIMTYITINYFLSGERK